MKVAIRYLPCYAISARESGRVWTMLLQSIVFSATYAWKNCMWRKKNCTPTGRSFHCLQQRRQSTCSLYSRKNITTISFTLRKTQQLFLGMKIGRNCSRTIDCPRKERPRTTDFLTLTLAAAGLRKAVFKNPTDSKHFTRNVGR